MKKLILCDFDGTISLEDTGYLFLTQFSKGDWKAIDQKYCAGEIGSQEAYRQIAKILEGEESAILPYLEQHSRIDPSFPAFYQACRQAGIDLRIISDGLDFYIRALLNLHNLSGIPVYANACRFQDGQMILSFPYSNKECGRCGTCKRNLVRHHRKEYDFILFVGNGYSDRCSAEEADAVFAKESLYLHCVNQDIPCSHFHHFDEILADLRKEIRGVIFDLDGTLIEAYEAIYLAMAEAFRYFNRPFYPYSDLKQHLKVDLEASLAPFFSQEEMLQAIPMIRKKYEEIYLEKTHFIEGARAILEGLSRKNLALAVATNKFGRFARGVLRHLGVADLFRSILGAGDGVRNKPFPDMIRISLGEMNLPRENVVFIGDSVEDVETGEKAGVDVFSIPTGVHTKEELSQGHPKRVLRNLEELLTITNQPPFFPRP